MSVNQRYISKEIQSIGKRKHLVERKKTPTKSKTEEQLHAAIQM